MAANTTYYQSTLYGYNVYTVLPTNKLSRLHAGRRTGEPVRRHASLPANCAQICQATAQSTIHHFGFDSLTGRRGHLRSTTTQTG